MEFLRKITDFIQELEEKDFYKYLSIVLFILLLLVSFMVYRYYSQVSKYTLEIEEVNTKRGDEVRVLLTRIEAAQRRKKEADEMLKKEGDFLIKADFEKLLEKLDLVQYKGEEGSVITKDAGDYNEDEFSIELRAMDMAQLCSILDNLEKKPRIKINSLEIKRSQSKPDSVDVILVMSTYVIKAEMAA